MVTNDEIVAVFGPHTSTNAMAVSDILKEAGMPYFTGGTSSKLKDLDNEYIFKVRCNDDLVVQAAMDYAVNQLGAKKIGILYINDEFERRRKGYYGTVLRRDQGPGIRRGES